jgi:hypothetical protein
MSTHSEFPHAFPKDFSPTGNPCNPDERGLLIGVGAQYTLHDLGDGRVVKIPNSTDGTRCFVGGWSPHFDATTAHCPNRETEYFREESVPHVLRLASRYQPLAVALGKPQVEPGNSFTQDKVSPLMHVIPTASPEDIQGYLNDLADLCLVCWLYGIHDRILNFGMNNGLDTEGRLVLVDFGETTFETWRVAKAVASRDWNSKALWVEKFLPVEFHDSYFQTMNDRLSPQNFERFWGEDLSKLDRELIRSPKLIERKQEIPSLVEQIFERANREEGWDIGGASSEVLALLSQYPWTACGHGLQNVLYRVSETCRGRNIQLEDIPPYILAKVDGEQKRQ